MDTKHTPGPWLAAAKPSSRVGLPIVSTVNGRSIAGVTFFMLGEAFSNHDKESDANARLIAAAPELLEALDALLNGDHPNRQYVNGHPAAAKARAAIAKATGAA